MSDRLPLDTNQDRKRTKPAFDDPGNALIVLSRRTKVRPSQGKNAVTTHEEKNKQNKELDKCKKVEGTRFGVFSPGPF
jgi:hypothetical protein